MIIDYLINLKENIDIVAIMDRGFEYAQLVREALKKESKSSRLIKFCPIWEWYENKDVFRLRSKYKSAKKDGRTKVSFKKFYKNAHERIDQTPNSDNVALLVDNCVALSVSAFSSIHEFKTRFNYKKVLFLSDPNNHKIDYTPYSKIFAGHLLEPVKNSTYHDTKNPELFDKVLKIMNTNHKRYVALQDDYRFNIVSDFNPNKDPKLDPDKIKPTYIEL